MTPKLEFAFKIHLDLGDRVKIENITSGGGRGFVPVTGGEVEGPRLNGCVVPYSGGDYPGIRPDGVVAFNARYMLDVLGVIHTAQVALETTTPSGPGAIKPVGDEDFLHIIMPMHIAR